ncbi:MAG: hypothetical protein E7469_05905 [Ruminococcaceae bacterium]|nr:hypothetical protein [Oscillospiraceae bacterium]
MAELKRKPNGPVYGNLAYDLDALVRERALEEAGRMPEQPRPERQRQQEVVQRPRTQTAAQPKAQVSPLVLGSVAVLAAMVVVLLMGYVKLTQISGNVADMKTELDKLNTEHVQLLTEYEQTFELSTIKEVAEAAGMSKPSAGQIEYVELGGSDTAVVYAAGDDGVLDRAFASAKGGVLALVEYFQ